jgi:hypothetical protein
MTLVIRHEQMRLLAEVPLAVFEDRLVEHLQLFAPRLYELRGHEGIRRVARSGIARARARGFTRRGPVRFWVELMFALGHRFDEDPLLGWVPASLVQQDGGDEMARARALFAAMQAYLARIEGPDKTWAIAALRRVAAAPWASLVGPGEPFQNEALAAMQRIWPEKAAAVGEPALRRSIAAAEAAAAARGVDDRAGRALIAGLMFGFGHGVLDDPLYPWVEDTLQSGRHADANQRAERLAAKTRIYVQAIAAHLAS